MSVDENDKEVIKRKIEQILGEEIDELPEEIIAQVKIAKKRKRANSKSPIDYKEIMRRLTKVLNRAVKVSDLLAMFPEFKFGLGGRGGIVSLPQAFRTAVRQEMPGATLKYANTTIGGEKYVYLYIENDTVDETTQIPTNRVICPSCGRSVKVRQRKGQVILVCECSMLELGISPSDWADMSVKIAHAPQNKQKREVELIEKIESVEW